MVNQDFEKELWNSACELRGNIDASEYKHVVLGLIFLKYVSDKFMDKYKELIEEGEGFENDKDEYISEGIFYVPEKARWEEIKNYSTEESIGKVIDEAMSEIERENKRLKGVLPKNFARPELDKRKLGNIVDSFSNIKIGSHDKNKDLLGRAYEYCLSKFAEQEGKLAGQFYTPECIVKTLVEVLKPYEGRVYDPCCGSGGMFVQSAKFIERHSHNINDISVYGQESNATTRKLCLMNLAIRGIEADLGPNHDDTFFNDLHPTLKADFILANPPFNLSNWGADALKDDKRWTFGTPPAGNANYAWLQHMIYHLSTNGKLGLVLANGSLSTQAGGEDKIRQKIVENDLIECIVALPPSLFYTTSIPVSLWFISKNKAQKGKTLFIDGRELGKMKNRKLRVLEESDIKKIAETVESFQNGNYKDVLGFCKSATIEDIKKQDFILTPGRYVGFRDEQISMEEFDDKMKRLTDELSSTMQEGNELDLKIKENLSKIGFDI
ncbi:type I restriction enzyme M protein [Methanococcus voltae]|uniref:site-specific DNA-methyltransferase (adenine-specific) n=1 Tax=Methanococcus voltae TaxID=2188 RepID=A0A8J7S5Y6_METVO|nr:class I SAM-dependent DNA methyltransferase [Methanococcus voltae]MBP2202008.1 type I restriction enzyme M protein [Methanococcus voltae]